MINGCNELMRLEFIKLVICVDQKNNPMALPKQIPAGAHNKKFCQLNLRFCLQTTYKPRTGTAIQDRQKAIVKPWTSESETITEAIAISTYPKLQEIIPSLILFSGTEPDVSV